MDVLGFSRRFLFATCTMLSVGCSTSDHPLPSDPSGAGGIVGSRGGAGGVVAGGKGGTSPTQGTGGIPTMGTGGMGTGGMGTGGMGTGGMGTGGMGTGGFPGGGGSGGLADGGVGDASGPKDGGPGISPPKDTAASDTTRMDVPDSSQAPGCGAGSLCRSLRSQYAEALLVAQSCTIGGPAACGLKAPGALGCDSCPVYVTDRTTLDALAKRFSEGGCETCFYDGAGAGDHCHPMACNELDAAICSSSPGGKSTCVNMPRDRTCRAGTMSGSACGGVDDYCTGGGKVCVCHKAPQYPPPAVWSCF